MVYWVDIVCDAGDCLIASPVTALPALPLLVILFVGMTLSYTFQRLAYKYDDKQNVLIEYWLDNSVFGHKAMRGQDYSLINPFQSNPAFSNLAEDISGFITACSGFFANSMLKKRDSDNSPDSGGSLGLNISQLFKDVRFSSQIVIKNFTKTSELHLSVELVMKDNRVLNNVYNLILKYDDSSSSSLGIVGYGSYFSKNTATVTQKEEDTIINIKHISIKDNQINFDNVKRGKIIVKYISDVSQNPVYPLYDIAYMDNDKY